MQKEWYVVNTYSGHENKVKEKLEQLIKKMLILKLHLTYLGKKL